MKIDFSVSGAKITSKNDRKEKHGDEQKIGVDIDISAVVPIEELEKLAIGKDKANYASMFFDDDGQVKTLGIKKLTFDREYPQHEAIIKVNNLSEPEITIYDVTIKKFAAELVFGKNALLSFQIQSHPDDEQIIFLTHALIKNDISVEIISPDIEVEGKPESQEHLI